MSDDLPARILGRLRDPGYRPQRPRKLARDLRMSDDAAYPTFRDTLRALMHEGRVVLGARGAVVLPSQRVAPETILGTYRQTRRGFGFVVPLDSSDHEDLFIPEGENGTALSGDVVRARIVSRGRRDGRAIASGRVAEVVQRQAKRFVGTLGRVGSDWVVHPDGNTLTEPVHCPDAASRRIRAGTKVVIELTSYPERFQRAAGVIVEVLGKPGEKDVDLRSIVVQFNLPGPFPDAALAEARRAVDRFDPSALGDRLDLTGEVVVTIDPDDAKDFDDAISLAATPDGDFELGIHIADVSHFVPAGGALDLEARERGNSTYFPGHVLPMLPEVLSNGVCSLQEDQPRLCKSAFVRFDQDARPVRTRFANTLIRSRKRLRYVEAQDLIDGAPRVRHPEGERRRGDYAPEVLDLLARMNALAKRIQARRRADGQLALDLPVVRLVLDEDGRVVDAVPEDTSYTHTLIEMFMVEANEAVARLLESIGVPFLRRIHPEPDLDDAERLRHFTTVSGHKLPKQLDRHAIQQLLERVRGTPESFALNMAVLKSLTRAEYSPRAVGHYALASACYAHFTSPIRRYADLTIHRLLDAYLKIEPRALRRRKATLEDAPDEKALVDLGKRLSYSERRSEDAERELRKVKVLQLLEQHVGEEYDGVVTGITSFGLFVQITTWLVEGLIRYEDLLDDWWDVDERGGVIRGQRTGQRIGIGDLVRVLIVRVDLPRRELDLSVRHVRSRSRPAASPPERPGKTPKPSGAGPAKAGKAKGKPKPNWRGKARGGASRRRR